MLRLRMHGDTPPLCHFFSGHGACLCTGTALLMQQSRTQTEGYTGIYSINKSHKLIIHNKYHLKVKVEESSLHELYLEYHVTNSLLFLEE
jgi:hypothetical protein